MDTDSTLKNSCLKVLFLFPISTCSCCGPAVSSCRMDLLASHSACSCRCLSMWLVFACSVELLWQHLSCCLRVVAPLRAAVSHSGCSDGLFLDLNRTTAVVSCHGQFKQHALRLDDKLRHQHGCNALLQSGSFEVSHVPCCVPSQVVMGKFKTCITWSTNFRCSSINMAVMRCRNLDH
jgi:hypothetical protein